MAEVAAKSCNLRHEFLDGTKLSVEVWSEINFWIPVRVFKVIEAQLVNLFRGWKADTLPEVSSLVVENKTHSEIFVRIAISGASKKALTHAAALLQVEAEGKILQGAKDPNYIGNSAVHSSISRQSRGISRRLSVLVLADDSKKALRYFGQEELFQTTQKGVDEMLHALRRGRGVELDKHPTDPIKDAIDCSICGGSAEHPVALQCGHTYCLVCLEDLCLMFPDMGISNGAIECQHFDVDICSKVPTLGELHHLLSHVTFEKVLEASFDAYIRRNGDVYGHCSTPDCKHIYAKLPQEETQSETESNDRAPAIACEGCLEITCLKCGEQHAGVTCAVFKHENSGEQVLLDAFKQEAGIRYCGNCGTSIEKTFGCNHMTCGGCGSHICWVCGLTFTTAIDCVDHLEAMQANHDDGDGDPWHNLEIV